MGIARIPLPAVETGIALSGVVLGLLVAFGIRAPLWGAPLIVGMFAVFHGRAHGKELPTGADQITYAVGFVIATGFLHLACTAIGHFWAQPGAPVWFAVPVLSLHWWAQLSCPAWLEDRSSLIELNP